MEKSNNQSIVYISGLGHSGSTLLDMLISSQKSIIGLGEVDKILSESNDIRNLYLSKFYKYPCTCGKNPSECKVWGAFKDFIDQSEGYSYAKGYEKFLDIVSRKTDANIIVDSSKNLNSLKKLYESLPELGIDYNKFYVIHLTKDVRGYIESATKSKKTLKKTLHSIYHWIKVNKMIEKYLKKNEIQYLNVGYEEVALSTEFTIATILKFINQDNSAVNTQIRETNAHILFGNNMRINQSDGIYYDYRWFTFSQYQKISSLLLPFLNNYNKRWVYSNTAGIIHKKNKKDSFVATKISHAV